MMTILKWLFNWLLKPLTDVINNYFAYKKERTIQESALLSDIVAADVQNTIERRKLQMVEADHAEFRIGKAILMYVFGLYYGLVIFDSIAPFHTGLVLKLPEPVATWSGWIMGYLFLAGGTSVTGLIRQWIFRR